MFLSTESWKVYGLFTQHVNLISLIYDNGLMGRGCWWAGIVGGQGIAGGTGGAGETSGTNRTKSHQSHRAGRQNLINRSGQSIGAGKGFAEGEKLRSLRAVAARVDAGGGSACPDLVVALESIFIDEQVRCPYYTRCIPSGQRRR